MRVIAGKWRGRHLGAPEGNATRPTAQRMRQAIFDMLVHAPWGGRALMEGATVLDAFAGTGAMGLEALSRGAAHAIFIENNAAALTCLRANIAACGASSLSTILFKDALRAPPGTPQCIIFLDPPYGQNLVETSLRHLFQAGWIDSNTIIIAENGAHEKLTYAGEILAQRTHGAACVTVLRGTDLVLNNK